MVAFENKEEPLHEVKKKINWLFQIKKDKPIS